MINKLKKLFYTKKAKEDLITDDQIYGLLWSAEETAAIQAARWGNWEAVPDLFVEYAQDRYDLSFEEATALFKQERTQEQLTGLMELQCAAAAGVPYSPRKHKSEHVPIAHVVGSIITTI